MKHIAQSIALALPLALASFGANAQSQSCLPDAASHCLKPQFLVAKGTVTSKYVYDVNLDVVLPPVGYGPARRTIIEASSLSNKFTPIALHPVFGWIDSAQCGTSQQTRLANCGWQSPTSNPIRVALSYGITNAIFADLDLVVRYTSQQSSIVDSGYLFQCLRFAGMPFCLPI